LVPLDSTRPRFFPLPLLRGWTDLGPDRSGQIHERLRLRSNQHTILAQLVRKLLAGLQAERFSNNEKERTTNQTKAVASSGQKLTHTLGGN